MDFSGPYLTQQIIAYIGNKRRLLELIYKAIVSVIPEIKHGLKFLDLFSGSGIVSRLGKSLNFEIFSNDWEYYSFIINNGFIKTNGNDIPRLFGSFKKFNNLLEEINNLPDPCTKDQYIAKYYAPGDFDINKADFRIERLFYTRDNALTIDKIRNYIDSEYEIGKHDEIRNILISLLLYEAATHTNTSGVFKAFHKGFGGHSRDALKRILTPIRLSVPNLINSSYPVHIYKEDANELVKSKDIKNIDIAYLDPPYNQHQYGSNYHMLNTIALWDKIPVPLTLNHKGVLKEKAAIRKDWVKTKSDYCYSETAISAFTDLLENLDAKYILISYSTDGLIPFEIMKDLCIKKGKIKIVTDEYTKYRGGKQSNSRLNTNIEFVLIIESGKKSNKTSIRKVETVINKKKILLMFKQKYSYGKFKAHCDVTKENEIIIDTGKKLITLKTINFFEIEPPAELEQLTIEESDVLYGILSRCVCHTKEEELEEIISKINGDTDSNVYFIKLIPNTLRKLAHKKNKERFYFWLKEIKKIEKAHKELFSLIKNSIKQIELLAEKRFNN